jgi:signal transduction histidine kinase
MRVGTMRAKLTDPGLVEELVKLEDVLDQALSRLRLLVFDLSPRILETGGLAVAVREALDKLGDDVELGFEDRLEQEPNRQVRALAYRIASEAITNVHKHAEVRRVDVILEQRDDGIVVRIADDGKGFDPGTSAEDGMGLVSMRERAELAGGWLKIRPAPGAGTTLEFWVPASAS